MRVPVKQTNLERVSVQPAGTSGMFRWQILRHIKEDLRLPVKQALLDGEFLHPVQELSEAASWQ